MLKIKDNIDLKELEKYGFAKWKRANVPNYIYVFDNMGKSTNKIVVHKDRTLRIVNINKIVINLLYDLIKVDLIEKVVE